MKRVYIFLLFLVSFVSAQETIHITFRHYPTTDKVVRAFVPGTFNNWGPNSNGFINPNAPSRMIYVDSLGYFVKTLPFRVGDTHNYKFHEQYNESGTEWQWFTDPLNPLINYAEYNNSILVVQRAMIFELYPKKDAFISDTPIRLAAGVFVAEDDSILLSQSTVTLDGQFLTTFEDHIIPDLSILSVELPLLSNGIHRAVVHLVTKNGESVSDSTFFSIASGDVYFITPAIDSVWASPKTIRWHVSLPQSAIKGILLRHINRTSYSIAANESGDYEETLRIYHGMNQFVVQVTDTANVVSLSDTLKLNYPTSQAPKPKIVFKRDGDRIRVVGQGHDPQGSAVTYLWATQPLNPAPLADVDGRTDASFELDVPTVSGDYALKLIAQDPEGNRGMTINFFTVQPDTVIIPQEQTIPSWVENAEIYTIFIKSYTSTGTIAAAAGQLEHIKNMGFNVVWVLPVTDVEGVIDQQINIGYNIVDFFHVDPVYGTNEDFRNFVRRAHELGLRVILDMTPNHTSRSHPIALDARFKRKFSRYYDFYQHEIIPHNDYGLGQSISPDGIVYYSAFSDALLNWNWADAEARAYMIDVYRYWLREFDIDGFRFDVYWGPHRRYGTKDFDIPLRNGLRALKADIMILGETNGTGKGSEDQYADMGGGLDLGYDWLLKDATTRFPSPVTLHARLYNSGYRPGPNSLFLRFLENQDEDRVAYRYNSIEKTIPVSTAIFMATGIPQIYQGQEVGMGYHMDRDRDFRVRSTVDWQNPPAKILAPHYQKLAQIRAQFPAFRQQFQDVNGDGKIDRYDSPVQIDLASDNSALYVLARPFTDENGLVVMNFSDQSITTNLNLKLSSWALFSDGYQSQDQYFLNDLYNDSSVAMSGEAINTMEVTLPPYGVHIFTISKQEEHVVLPAITVGVENKTRGSSPGIMQLQPNYPNPFNPTTTILYSLSKPEHVVLSIYNLHGQLVRVLMDRRQKSGEHQVLWDGRSDRWQDVPTGIYFCRLKAGALQQVRKMTLIR